MQNVKCSLQLTFPNDIANATINLPKQETGDSVHRTSQYPANSWVHELSDPGRQVKRYTVNNMSELFATTE